MLINKQIAIMYIDNKQDYYTNKQNEDVSLSTAISLKQKFIPTLCL